MYFANQLKDKIGFKMIVTGELPDVVRKGTLLSLGPQSRGTSGTSPTPWSMPFTWDLAASQREFLKYQYTWDLLLKDPELSDLVGFPTVFWSHAPTLIKKWSL
eukprot:SAG22_NODE_1451_length_4395_cov_4.435987_7_plen_103_part_00